jgi:DNA-binding transcriptional LysR family regulator
VPFLADKMKRMSLQIKWLEDFLILSQTMNFSEASMLRHVSQPAFSRRIQTLERHLNCKLVNRLTQPIKLTDQGVLFSQTCQQVLTKLEQGVKQITPQQITELIFSASHCLSIGVFPLILQHINRLPEKITTKLKVADADDCIEQLTNHQCHYLLAFSDSLLSTQQKDSLLLGLVKLLPVCKADDSGKPIYALPLKNSCNESDIPYLAYQQNIYLGRVVDKILTKNKAKYCMKKTTESSMADGLKMLALKGLGIAWIPEFSIQTELETKKLAICGDKQWQEELEIRIYQHSHSESQLEFIWKSLAELKI